MNSLLHGSKSRPSHAFQWVINTAWCFSDNGLSTIQKYFYGRCAYLNVARCKVQDQEWNRRQSELKLPSPRLCVNKSFFHDKMHKLADVFDKLESKRFFSLPCSRKSGHYTVQQIQNSGGERHVSTSSSSSSNSPLVGKPIAASYPGCRSRPSSSPRRSPNFRSRLQSSCRRYNSQVGTEFTIASVCEQFLLCFSQISTLSLV